MREVRRERRYDGLILDPPTYGHGPGGSTWSMDDLPDLLDACRALLEPGAIALLTAHTPGFDPDRLTTLLAAHLGRDRSAVQAGDLGVATRDGRRLELGAFARIGRTGRAGRGAIGA